MTQPADRLDNTRTTFHSSTVDLREQRWDLRDDLRSITRSDRLRACGRTRIAPGVTVRLTNGIAGYVGLATCGSPWLCPVCAAKIAMRRGLEMAAGFDWWLNETQRPLIFPTATAQHHAGHDLAPLLDAVVKAWRTSLSGRFWMEDRDDLMIVGVIRTLEVLRSQRNGWHPHIHAVMPCGPDVTDAQVAAVGQRFFRRWSKALERAGYGSLPVAQTFDLIRPGAEDAARRVGQYLAKLPDYSMGQSLGYELTGTQNKSGRSSGRTQWQLAESAVAGNKRDAALWREFESATYNRRQTTYSPGLRDVLRLGAEQTDEQIASEVLGTDDDAVVWISPEGWSTIYRLRIGHTLLRVLEQSYQQYLRALVELEIDHVQIRSHTS